MTWSMVAMIGIVALIGVCVLVVVYAVIETLRNNDHKRKLEWANRTSRRYQDDEA